VGGAISEAAGTAIEAWLDAELQLPEPSEEACRRYHAAHLSRYAQGEQVQARHVLFAVTPGVDVNALRQRAEACLLDVRCAAPGTDRFAEVAASTSNCPSGAQGGALGWLTTQDIAPELANELFGHTEVGVLPRLVHSRFGLHVVEVLARQAGTQPPFEAVHAAVAQSLRQHSFATALRQALQVLAGQADVQGVDLDAATSPLLQ
jgi:peptidyl-prolyl cis-trans isomerase C